MSNDEEKNVLLNVLAGIGLGAIIGAAAGLLFAPKPGAETREDVKKAVEDLKTKAEDLAGEISASVDDLVHKSRELVEGAKAKVEQGIEAGKQVVAEKKEEPTTKKAKGSAEA